MSNENHVAGNDGFDPSKVQKLSFTEILKRIGPGIILTGVVIGPGNITTSAMIGANYGYGLLWLIIPILLMGVTFMLTSYRISMLTGMPILHAIRHYYGGAAAGFCGIALFLSCLFFTLGNVSGTGAGMNLISGAIMLVGAIVLNPQGIAIQAPAQLAELLVPFLGGAAKYVMGIALLGAGFSSLLGNTQRGMVLLSAGFNKDVALESKIIRWGCVASLAFACVICFIYDGSPTQLIFIANIATSIATPVAGLLPRSLLRGSLLGWILLLEHPKGVNSNNG